MYIIIHLVTKKSYTEKQLGVSYSQVIVFGTFESAIHA